MSKAQSFDESKIGPLIERLGPLNNLWRDGTPQEKVLMLWRMGDTLLKEVAKPSDALLWQIQDRSYITRNLLRYALIIRRAWSRQKELEKLTQGLKNYTVFRESLPFLKDKREGIDDATYQWVVALLSSEKTQETLRYLKKLKAQQIGRHHKKGASVTSVRELATNFVQALIQLETQARDELKAGSIASNEALIILSRIAMNLATGEPLEQQPVEINADEPLNAVARALQEAARGWRTTGAAFRKAVGAERLMQAADLLNSLRDEQALIEWRRRHGVR
ncbi:MAG: hypothetical protein WBP93_13855 [Pyrinomonadaceae bacterium]